MFRTPILNSGPVVQVWSSASRRSARWSSHYYQGTCSAKNEDLRMQRKKNSPKREVVWMLQWSISGSFSLAQKKTESPYSSLLGLWHSSHPMVQSISWVLPKEWLCRGKAAVPLAGLSVGLAHPSCPGCALSYMVSFSWSTVSLSKLQLALVVEFHPVLCCRILYPLSE